jgi:DNA adenine methylase
MTTDTDSMKIKALAPWFGGKRTLAPEIVAEIGDHAAWWELGCGSMAVTFAKEPASMETAIDLHGDLTNLAFVLQQRELAEQLYDRLYRTLVSREASARSQAIICENPAPQGDDTPDVDRAYHYMIVSWIGRNGAAGTNHYNTGFCVRYTKNGGAPATRFASAVESIPGWHVRLKGVTILRADLFEVVGRIEDSPGVVIYVDPPYVKKGARYLHDFEADDHPRLAKLLGRFEQTRVIVSYYDHPVVRELYAGWTLRQLQATKALVNQGMRDRGGAVEAPEVLLINGPSYVNDPEAIYPAADTRQATLFGDEA